MCVCSCVFLDSKGKLEWWTRGGGRGLGDLLCIFRLRGIITGKKRRLEIKMLSAQLTEKKEIDRDRKEI